MENKFELIRTILIVATAFLCGISAIVFFSIADGDGVLDCIELIYLVFIFVYGFLALLFVLMEDDDENE